MARQVYSAESLGNSTNGTVTPSTKVTLTFTPDANSDYLILWSCDASIASTSVDFRVDLYDGTTAQGETRYEPSTSGAGKFHSAGGIWRYQAGASPTSQTFSIRFYAETATNNVVVRNARLVAIKLTANDVYADTAGPTTTTSTAYSTLNTLTVTPATDGDYLVLTSHEIGSSSTSNSAKARLLIDGATAVDEWIGVAQNEAANQRIGIVMVRRFTWDTTAHTVAQQHCTETSTPTITSNRMRAVAIRLDDGWVDSAYNNTDNRATKAGDGNYTTFVTVTEALNRQATIFAWRAELDTTGTGADVKAKGLCGCGTTVTDTNFRMAASQRHIVFGFGVIVPGLTGSLDSTIQYAADAGVTVGIRNATMAILNPGDLIVSPQDTTLVDADVINPSQSAVRTPVEADAAGAATVDYVGSPKCTAYAEASVRIGAAPSATEIADTVWAAIAAQNNIPGTMGEKLNSAGSASNPWTDPTGAAVATKTDELHQLHGLKSGSPMTVTPTSRAVGSISQTISGDGTTSTTVTRV